MDYLCLNVSFGTQMRQEEKWSGTRVKIFNINTEIYCVWKDLIDIQYGYVSKTWKTITESWKDLETIFVQWWIVIAYDYQ